MARVAPEKKSPQLPAMFCLMRTLLEEVIMNKKCVYLHRLNGEVVYVGSGNLDRVKHKSGRSREHRDIFHLLEFEIVAENLSNKDSRELEESLIKEYLPTGNLFNKSLKSRPTKEILYDHFKDFLYYDPTSKTGLRWKAKTTKAARHIIGNEAGSYSKTGYYNLGFFGTIYRIHRVVYSIYHKIDVPTNMVIDHIDGNRLNNEISNLRLISQSDNSLNRLHRKTISEHLRVQEEKGYRFRVEWTEENKRKSKSFMYTQGRSREDALTEAIAFRDELISKGFITVREEQKGMQK